ncbi:hypothetical protein [Candidatus Phytoplasma bonamiae]|uniref:Uncharacterized protein n=1 Tax=Candidatus Phytoplasma bonamiae TaxID=2982626 RepID=A0ABT9D4Q8_9MOLU|nr:hypothetical protein ['Bonamia sp.' little leaf phytoplasma]MDO8064002.1 hypothetical protein ['Bonamia sp.' little leaf phytoplasma]MDV3174516.1 hypothetical protein ['Bonamia sp.' little leaf phytoplasma]
MTNRMLINCFVWFGWQLFVININIRKTNFDIETKNFVLRLILFKI